MKVAKQTFKFFVLLSMLFTSAFVMADTTINDGKSDGGQVDTKRKLKIIYFTTFKILTIFHCSLTQAMKVSVNM